MMGLLRQNNIEVEEDLYSYTYFGGNWGKSLLL